MAKPEEVLARLAADLLEALGDELLSLAVHGSWALGDFIPGRSDLDVLAGWLPIRRPATLAVLHEVHGRLARDFPDWGDGYVEVEYVAVEAIRAVVQGTDESHPMISVGKGEPLHELEASRHSVLNWAAALQADRPIAGAAPSSVLPAIERRLVHKVVLQHIRAWPRWMGDIQHPGAGDQAYTVLTLCRAAEALATGRQLSKLAAAKVGRSRFPEWSALIDWAREWWYNGGSDLDHGRVEDVRRFVDESAHARYGTTTSCPTPATMLPSSRCEAAAARQGRPHRPCPCGTGWPVEPVDLRNRLCPSSPGL